MGDGQTVEILEECSQERLLDIIRSLDGHLKAAIQGEHEAEEKYVAAGVRANVIENKRDEAMALLTEIHNGFARDTDGGHYAFFGGVMYDRIKKALGIDRPMVMEMEG